ncbi:22189_t:CDS:2, partial [Cetraspora pellucida]
DLTFQGVALILFPPNQPINLPNAETIIKRFKEFLDLGFKIDINNILKIFCLFENRIDDIGDIFVNSFILLRLKEIQSMKDICLTILKDYIINTTVPILKNIATNLKLTNDEDVGIQFDNFNALINDCGHVFNNNLLEEIKDTKKFLSDLKNKEWQFYDSFLQEQI